MTPPPRPPSVPLSRLSWARTVLATLWRMGTFWRRPHRAAATLYLLAVHIWRWRKVGPALEVEIECGVRMIQAGRTHDEVHAWILRRRS